MRGYLSFSFPLCVLNPFPSEDPPLSPWSRSLGPLQWYLVCSTEKCFILVVHNSCPSGVYLSIKGHESKILAVLPSSRATLSQNVLPCEMAEVDISDSSWQRGDPSVTSLVSPLCLAIQNPAGPWLCQFSAVCVSGRWWSLDCFWGQLDPLSTFIV